MASEFAATAWPGSAASSQARRSALTPPFPPHRACGREYKERARAQGEPVRQRGCPGVGNNTAAGAARHCSTRPTGRGEGCEERAGLCCDVLATLGSPEAKRRPPLVEMREARAQTDGPMRARTIELPPCSGAPTASARRWSASSMCASVARRGGCARGRQYHVHINSAIFYLLGCNAYGPGPSHGFAVAPPWP